MATYPLPSLAATVNSQGISAPNYQDILNSLISQVQAIYGSDIVLDTSSQDYQLLAIVALAINDANQTAIAVYNQFSPATAVGAGLSSVIKINGIAREIASNSQVDLVITGVAGTELNGAQASDVLGQLWNIPNVSIIDASGQIVVTATADRPGATTAEAGTVTTIATPIPGWQSVVNIINAVVGQPVEQDAQLRLRQSSSTALPSLTVVDGLNGAIAAIPGVVRFKTYENDLVGPDQNGIPGHSIAVVVEGGDAFTIASTIALKKTPGCGTYGDVGFLVEDQQGVPNAIYFWPLQIITILVQVTLTAFDGYTSVVGQNIISQVSNFVTGLPIGYDVFLSKVEAATELSEPAGLTYDVTQVLIQSLGDFSWDIPDLGWDQGSWGGPLQAADVDIGFNQAAQLLPSAVALIVNPS